VDEENPYWISFSDILAGLLVIFMLASIQLVIQLFALQEQLAQRRQDVEQAIEELARANHVRGELLDEIKAELERRNIIVEVSDNKSVLRIPEEQLHFRSGSHQIPPVKEDLVAIIGEVLLQAMTKSERYRYLDTIFVEGHTDSQPATMLEMGNWGLSAKRAISLWHFWTERNASSEGLQRLRNFRGQPLFSVSGYAATRRLVEQDDTPETQQRNRRIDLRFTVRQPSIKDWKGVLGGS
jgi:flagellar motor protein MotB